MCDALRNSGCGHCTTCPGTARSRTTGWSSSPPPDPAPRRAGLSETPVQEHLRIHLDLYADNAAEQAAEVARLVALGAEEVDWDLYPEDPDFIVLSDTEGNRFCVIDTGHG
jgi:hypothetical protein